MPSIEIFKTGKHTAMNGAVLSFSDVDVKASAESYDPALHEAPVCIGHPTSDGPAYGWVKGLSFADGSLSADLDQVEPEFAEMVKAGRFKKISAAFYPPNSPSNPSPGTYYLRHVGFLGAQPPAVKGLKAVQFAEGDDVVVFGDWNDQTIAGLFRGLREFIIEKFGLDAADKALPGWSVDTVQNNAVQPEPDQDDLPTPAFNEEVMTQTAAEIKAAQDNLAADQAAFAAQQAAFAEQQKAIVRTEDKVFLDGLVAKGQLLPAELPAVAAFMESVPTDNMVAFSEGGQTKEKSARDLIKSLLQGRSPQVAFGEFAKPEEVTRAARTDTVVPAGYAVDPDRAELHAQALAFQEKHPGTDYITAVKTIEQQG